MKKFRICGMIGKDFLWIDHREDDGVERNRTGRNSLARGYTTGTCAQAATKAAAAMLFGGGILERVEVELPGGERLELKIEDVTVRRAEETQELPSLVSCAVRKDSGDDPDVTDQTLVYSAVSRKREPGILLEGGRGVGRVTKPGLEQPVGNAAINRVPREMILREAEAACEEAGYEQGLRVEISVPEGERLAAKTFNPRLGIEGGISILGTTGIVEPMSEQALIDTIRLDLKVKLASGNPFLIAAPGNYGLDFLKASYGIEPDEAVKCSNYIGQTLEMAEENGCRGLVLAGHIGKLVKVAGGIFNTHSRWADCRMELLGAAALRSGLGEEKALRILESLTTEDALSQCSEPERERLMETLMTAIRDHLIRRITGEMELGVIVFSNRYGILGKSDNAEALIQKYQSVGGNKDA